MWKIFFEYPDGGKCIVTGKGEITLEQAVKYHNQYGTGLMKREEYQKYPKKDNEPIDLFDLIMEMNHED